MVCQLIVALDAGIERVTALVSDGNNVAPGMIMSALRTLIYTDAVADYGLVMFHLATNQTALLKTCH